jgi:C1A family cysteine protease
MNRRGLLVTASLAIFLWLGDDAFLVENRELQQVPQRCPMNPDYLSRPYPSQWGYLPPPMDLSHLGREASMARVGALEALPAAWDWRAHNGTTPAKDQGSCPTCWVFAGTGTLESRVLVNSGLAYDLAEENVKECNDVNRGCFGGTEFIAANYFINHGAVLEACSPYHDDPMGICNSSCPKVIRPTGWRLVGSSDVQAIKSAIYHYGPCYSSLFASWAGFINYDGSYVLYYTGAEPRDHAVMIVGWDDNLPHAGGKGAWIGKNSWGTAWGNDGFFYIAYGSAGIGQITSYFDSYKYHDYQENLYLYDEGGWLDSYGFPGSNTAWGLVKFIATRDECVQAVDFWATVYHLNYTIFIYDHFDGYNVSNLLYSQSGTIDSGGGYFSIPLNSPVCVPKGDDFVVVVKFICTTGYAYTVPTDYVDTYYPIESAKCFISPSGSPGSWTDMGVEFNRDIGIRARTKYYVPVFYGHDFDGNGTSDLAIWRPANKTWYIKDVTNQSWGLPGDLPANGDYDGNRVTDIAVWRPTNGIWYIRDIGAFQWGVAGDIPVPGDYNGDNVTDIAVWRPSNGVWYIRNIGTFQWGVAGDIPVPGDYNGDNVTDIAVWRPSNGVWYIRNIGSYQWGALGDIPVAGNYDADSSEEIAVWRPRDGRWYIKDIGSYQWGAMRDIPVPGDYNGDNVTDIAVWRPSNGVWYIRNIGNYQWGASGDIPVVR